MKLITEHDEATAGLIAEITSVHFACCIRCGRKLTNKTSMRRGYGRKCRNHLNRAARQVALTFSETQVRKAANLLRSECVTWDGTESVYRVISGESIYWTSPERCTCPAGEHGRRCYHRCAVRIKELTPYAR